MPLMSGALSIVSSKNAKGYKKKRQHPRCFWFQQMLKGGQEVLVGAVTDPSFGK